jgi:UDPglucose 6-dehydrogenase
MKLSVIGASYVGLTAAACLAQIGHEVLCSESDAEKLANLRDGRIPLAEPYLSRVVDSTRKAGSSTYEASRGAEAILIVT